MTPTIAIFGAGLSGICLGIQLKRAGIDSFTIFEKSELAYTLLRNLGAAYLMYVGIRFLFSASKPTTSSSQSLMSARAAFFQGFWSNLFNPKSLVFLLAFLPQFVDPARGDVAIQLIVLGLIHKSVGLLVDGSVAMLAGSGGNWLKQHPRFIKWQERMVGTILVSLGLRLAFDGRN